MRAFWDLRWFFWQERFKYSFGILLLVIVALLSLLPPYVVGVVVDAIEQNRLTTGMLARWMGAMIAAGICMYVLRYVWRIMIFGSSLHLGRTLRYNLYQHFTRMSSDFFGRKRTGDLMAHATNDITAVQMMAGQGVLTIVDSLVMGGFVVLAMAVGISWQLTLITLLPMPLMALLTSWYGHLLHQRFGAAQQSFSQLNNRTQESISGVKVTKTFGYEQEDIEAFDAQSRDVVNKNERVARIDALFDPTITLIIGVCYLLAIGFGAGYVNDGSITIGQLTTFSVYLGMLIWPMLAFGWFFNIIERGHASYDRIRSLMAERTDITDQEAGVDQVPAGAVHISIDEFSYPRSETNALHDIHASVQPGQTIGIVGRTGSGKTTLLRLLLRELKSGDGAITIGGTPAEAYYLDTYRLAFGNVPQEHFLFSMTLADNIAFSSPEATQQDIQRAAGLAAIHDDIVALPGGYATAVGERGVTLSGGQKQRISIARALLQNPEILILDDALSAVDANTEQQILEALKQERRGKTTFIVTHRMSTVKEADAVWVMEHGTIVENGSHRALMEAGGIYAEMVKREELKAQVERGDR